jgi:plastocyanin
MTPQKSAYHTITACKAPCTGSTGIAYPRADAKIEFDSGELGYGPKFGGASFTPAANRNTWKTPKTLPTGTYTYFCRIHPFMRGSFRVVK